MSGVVKYRITIRDTGTFASEYNIFKYEWTVERKGVFRWKYETCNWFATEEGALNRASMWLGRSIPDQYPLVYPDKKVYQLTVEGG